MAVGKFVNLVTAVKCLFTDKYWGDNMRTNMKERKKRQFFGEDKQNNATNWTNRQS